MTTHDKDKIISAARMVGAKIDMHGPDERDDIISMHPDKLTHFYAIAFEDGRKAEREECAIEAEKQAQDEPYGHAKFRCHNIAEAIRARGDTK